MQFLNPQLDPDRLAAAYRVHNRLQIADILEAQVAEITERLGLPSIGTAVARRMTHKIAMRRCLAEEGVPQPAFAGVRDLANAPIEAAETVPMPDLSAPFISRQLVQDCDAVVHLAGLAHSSGRTPSSLYSAVNSYAPQNLAVACRDAGVKVFVFVSSVRASLCAEMKMMPAFSQAREKSGFSLRKP